MTPLYRTSRPHESVLPRAQSGYTREHTHGPLIGMDREEAFLERIKPLWRKSSKVLFWIALAGLIPFAWHLGWFAWSLV